MPQNLEAERRLLGAVLLDNHTLPRVVEKIAPEDFFLHHHRLIYYSMLEMGEKHIPIDLVTLTETMRTACELEAAGGIGYIAQLVDGVPNVTNVEYYAKIVKEKSALRKLIVETESIQRQAFEGHEDAETILGKAKSSIDKLTGMGSVVGLVKIDAVAQSSYDQINRMYENVQTVTGLSTGYRFLDTQTAGFQPSELIVLAARPSQGKSSLALNITENVSMRNKFPVAFFSLEMSARSLFMRLLSATTKIDSHRFRTGHLSTEDKQRIPQGVIEISDSPIWIDDSSSCTVADIHARAYRLKREFGLALIVVDYIQLVGVGSGRRSKRQEEVSEISRSLKGLAKDLEVPVLALSQLTRAPEQENRRPQLADLRESGAIEQDADVVLFIYRPFFYKKSEDMENPAIKRAQTELIIAKQRNGPIGEVKFVFQESTTRFEETIPELWGEQK